MLKNSIIITLFLKIIWIFYTYDKNFENKKILQNIWVR